jgi:nucleotide-binding universal stress UspA family protein
VIAAIMVSIWVTIPYSYPPALLFLLVILGSGMGLRTLTKRVPVPVPAEAVPEAAIAEEEGIPPFDPAKGRILVATQRNLRMLRFAFDEAKRRDANIFVLFVRDIAGILPGAERPMSPDEDTAAAKLFRQARDLSREHGVPLQPIYCVNPDAGDVILDFAATYAADLVILGVSRRAAVLQALRGNVISAVADHLPSESTLLIHA